MMLEEIQKNNAAYAVLPVHCTMAELDGNTISMINCNQPVIGFAPIRLEETDGVYQTILFDITGKVSLTYYLKKSYVSGTEFRDLIAALVRVLEQTDEYMIDRSSILLDLDTVYINVADKTVSFLCAALNRAESGDGSSLYRLFSDIVRASYVTAAAGEPDYYNCARNYLRDENGFSLQNLLKAINRAETVCVQDEAASKDKGSKDPFGTVTVTRNESETQWSAAKPVEPEKETKKENPDGGLFSFEEEPEKKGLFGGLFSKKKDTHKDAFEGGLAGIAHIGRGKNDKQAEKESIDDFFEKKPEKKEKDSALSMELKEQISSPFTESKNSSDVKTDYDVFAAGGQSCGGKTFDLNGTMVIGAESDLNKTMVMSGVQESTPYLIREKTGEKIMLRRPMFSIGRVSDLVDYAVQENYLISSKHISFVCRGSEWFFIDNHSTNGTYLNGSLVESMREIPLKSDVEIRLANEVFSFRF